MTRIDMKVLTVIVGATTASAMHYTEPNACAETISYGISKVADSMLSLRSHHSALDIIGSLKHAYEHTKGLHEAVADCKKIALLPGIPTPRILPGVPPPEDKKILSGVPTPQYVDGDNMLPGVPAPKILPGVPTPKYLEKNVTVTSECLEDIKGIVDDALKAAHSIEDAANTKSIESALEAVKEVRMVESDLSKAKAACSYGEVHAEAVRSPCARKIDFALGELFAMENDIKAVIGGDLMRAFAMEHELTGFPDLALQVKQACMITDLEHEAVEIEKLAHIKRRHFGWGMADKLKELASSASAKVQKEAARAACFGSSLSVVKDIKALAGKMAESVKNMTLHGLEDTDHLHSHVSNAIVECQNAIIA